MGHVIKPLAALIAVAALSGSVHAQQTVTLKMQATWPFSLTLYDNFTFFADRVSKISGGTLKIDAMPAGQMVSAFEAVKRFYFPPYSFAASYYWPKVQWGGTKAVAKE